MRPGRLGSVGEGGGLGQVHLPLPKGPRGYGLGNRGAGEAWAVWLGLPSTLREQLPSP